MLALEEGSVLHLVRRPLMPEAATPSPAPPPISPAPAPSPPPLYARTRQFVNQMEQDLHISRPQEPAMSDAEPERLLNSLVDRTGAIASRVGDYLSPLVARGVIHVANYVIYSFVNVFPARSDHSAPWFASHFARG